MTDYTQEETARWEDYDDDDDDDDDDYNYDEYDDPLDYSMYPLECE